MGSPRQVQVVGDVVCRPAGPWTSTVHALLLHLHAAGLPVPEPLGVEAGIETVRWLTGDAGEGAWPHQVTLGGVRSAGCLLRAIHDATVSWVVPDYAVWAVPAEQGSAGVVCHGDPKPPNMVWYDHQAVGLFDWDDARPAPPLSDVAYALTWISPFFDDDDELRRRGLSPDIDVMARAAAFLDGYGWTDPIDIAAAVIMRRRQAIDEVVYLGQQGHEPSATWVPQGWPDRWRNSLSAHAHHPRSGARDHPAGPRYDSTSPGSPAGRGATL